MNYPNGRVAVLNDRVVAIAPSGKFIGTVSAFEGDHLRVHPMFSQSALYIDPASALHLDDALKPAPAPIASTPAVPSPAVTPAVEPKAIAEPAKVEAASESSPAKPAV